MELAKSSGVFDSGDLSDWCNGNSLLQPQSSDATSENCHLRYKHYAVDRKPFQCNHNQTFSYNFIAGLFHEHYLKAREAVTNDLLFVGQARISQ